MRAPATVEHGRWVGAGRHGECGDGGRGQDGGEPRGGPGVPQPSLPPPRAHEHGHRAGGAWLQDSLDSVDSVDIV